MDAVTALNSHPDWLSGWVGALMGGVIGAVLGGFIPLGWNAWRRNRERRGEILAMQVELRVAQLHMESLLEKEDPTPLYRLPIAIFERTLPKLIGERKLTLNEIGLLVEYVNRAVVNRGFDLAAEKSIASPGIRLVESAMNRERAKAMLHEKLQRHGDLSLRDGAWEVMHRLHDSLARRAISGP